MTMWCNCLGSQFLPLYLNVLSSKMGMMASLWTILSPSAFSHPSFCCFQLLSLFLQGRRGQEMRKFLQQICVSSHQVLALVHSRHGHLKKAARRDVLAEKILRVVNISTYPQFCHKSPNHMKGLGIRKGCGW